MLTHITISPEARDGFLLQYSGDSLMDRVYREGFYARILDGTITVKGEEPPTNQHCAGCPGWREGKCTLDECPFFKDDE